MAMKYYAQRFDCSKLHDFFLSFLGGEGVKRKGGGNLFANFTFMNNQNIIN